jgi:hypothetical protein
MIDGAHVMLYSKNAEADRAFFRDILKFHHVDAGEGWLIFALPPSEFAVHPAAESGALELGLTCKDIAAFVATMQSLSVPASPVENVGWGLSTHITLPGGSRLRVYQPRYGGPNG